MNFGVLCCTLLYFIVLCCTLLYFIALCCSFLKNFDFDIIKSTNEKGGLKMKTIFVYIIVSVFARLVGDEISKWLNKHFKSDK